MKTIILISATIFFFGLTTVIEDLSLNTKKSGRRSNEKAVNYKAYNENFGIGKSKNSSEELRYEVRGIYSRSIKKEQLSKANLISDIIQDYPINWITSYVSIEILGTCEGKFMTAVSTNSVLTKEQKNILNNVDMASDVIIDIKYTYNVPVTNVVENNIMHILMTVVPEIQAEYIGGYQQMINYLKENSIHQFSEKDPKKVRRVVIKFTISEEGNITGAKITHTSGNAKAENLLLDVINNMPKWKPAENAQGVKVKQEFEFIVGNIYGDGC